MAEGCGKSRSMTFWAGKARFLIALAGVFLALLALSFWVSTAHAEGSNDLVEQNGYRPYTERYGAATAGESRLTEIGAYVQAGEYVAFGGSVKTATLGLTNAKMGTNFSAAQLALSASATPPGTPPPTPRPIPMSTGGATPASASTTSTMPPPPQAGRRAISAPGPRSKTAPITAAFPTDTSPSASPPMSREFIISSFIPRP